MKDQQIILLGTIFSISIDIQIDNSNILFGLHTLFWQGMGPSNDPWANEHRIVLWLQWVFSLDDQYFF